MNTSPSEDGFRSSLDRKKTRDGKAFPEPTIGLCIVKSCMFTKGTYQYSLLNATELQTIYTIYTDFNFQKPFNIFTQRFMPPMTQKILAMGTYLDPQKQAFGIFHHPSSMAFKTFLSHTIHAQGTCYSTPTAAHSRSGLTG